MKKLLSLPPHVVDCFHDITGLSKDEWFCTHDPIDRKLGSGGGTAWLLEKAFESEKDATDGTDFTQWLSRERRILLHAGGQSRRLPAYAPSGKILTPIPVFRWERGQQLSQNLLSLQLPLYEKMMADAPSDLHTMVVSGDVYIRTTERQQPIPDADVVCYGLWLDSNIASHHGVFVCDRQHPEALKCMLQKPTVQALGELQKDHFYLTDIGVWLLSDRAVEVLMRKSQQGNEIGFYDLYTEFGGALGTHPTLTDNEVNALSVAVVPLHGGEFYHFGTSRELISSMLAVQNLTNDQRRVLHHSLKPHPAMFVQNAETWVNITEQNHHLWIENSCVSEGWTLEHDHVITGVPDNAWKIELLAGQCVDIVPIGESQYAVRPYGMDDTFRGALNASDTLFIGKPFPEWAKERRIELEKIENGDDLQAARIFPVVDNESDAGLVLRWMLNEPFQDGGRMLWNMSPRLSADEVAAQANLQRLSDQRKENRGKCLPFLAKNHRHSIFYQLDLENTARLFVDHHIAVPHPLSDEEPLLTRIHDAMFRSEVARLKGTGGEDEAVQAFSLLSEGLTSAVALSGQQPRLSVCSDQIVWGRSPVRIDLAGGWTDTPPFCLMEGGSVVNIAIELNGQPPLHAYVRPSKERKIVLRSIDMGAMEQVTTYEQLADFQKVGSPFSIPKAALALAGFLPAYSEEHFNSLEDQLEAFGAGIEVTLLSAIPAGSGLGTSSLLASTVLGALNDFCGLGWDKNEIGRQTLVLEQLLTTGGGWQDQFGGLLHGVKLLQTEQGFEQSPVVHWLPDTLFTNPEYRHLHLLYYTGITRTAKKILGEIVRKMFLNQHAELALLREMKAHAHHLFEALQRNDFRTYGELVRKTWQQNQLLDSGTNPEEVQRLTAMVDDLCAGYKLPGAGGGGYLYMIAKDTEAAARIRQRLTEQPLNANARFVEMSLCEKGLQVSRS